MYNVIDDNGVVYFSGTYFECDEWRYMNCEDNSYIDNNSLEECEVLLYKGKIIYLQKIGD